MEEKLQNKIIKILLDNKWFKEKELLTKYFKDVDKCINNCKSPKQEDIFNAFIGLSPEDVKVLIIGQDPYPEIGRADGMAFSFGNGDTPKDSLGNIFAKLEEAGIKNHNTSLENWKKQGVLLLNTALTYKENEEHFKHWKPFIDTVISKLINKKVKNNPLVIMLFGEKANLLDSFKDDSKDEEMKEKGIFIIRTSHPCNMSKNYCGNYSVLRANVKPFADENYNPFIECNRFLKDNNIEPINWQT